MDRSFCAVGAAGATRKGAECRERWSGPEDIVYCVPGCQHHVEMALLACKDVQCSH